MPQPSAPFADRLATPADAAAIAALMDAAIERLLGALMDPALVRATRESMGLDSQLIADGTYFVITAGEQLVASGGWSDRATLYGGDHAPVRDDTRLDPRTDAARIRAMYTHPDWARRGLGRRMLGLCEGAAAAAGFTRAGLAATPSGELLYAACGYEVRERTHKTSSDGLNVPLVMMEKALV
ncbi:MAG: GNAT family N-acetyltransferase [Caulobacterales bacterium]|nr:GNAT family N-acetyltransferase [Caulobacterales bacterium]